MLGDGTDVRRRWAGRWMSLAVLGAALALVPAARAGSGGPPQTARPPTSPAKPADDKRADDKRCPGPARAARLETAGRERSRRHAFALLAERAVVTGKTLSREYWRLREAAFHEAVAVAFRSHIARPELRQGVGGGFMAQDLCRGVAGRDEGACGGLAPDDAGLCRAVHAIRAARSLHSAAPCADQGFFAPYCAALAVAAPCPQQGPGAALCRDSVAAMRTPAATCSAERPEGDAGCLPTLLALAWREGESRCDLAFDGPAPRRAAIRAACHAIMRRRPAACPAAPKPPGPDEVVLLRGFVRGGPGGHGLVFGGSAPDPLICWVEAEVRDGRGRRRARWSGALDVPGPGSPWVDVEVPLAAAVDPFDATVTITHRCLPGLWR